MSKPCAARCKNWCFLLIQRSNLKPLKLSKTSKVWWRHEPEGSPHSRSKSKEDRCGSRCGTAPQRDCWRIRPKRPPLFSCSRPSGTSAPHMRWSTSSKDRGPFNIFRASCAKNVWLNPYVVYIYIYNFRTLLLTLYATTMWAYAPRMLEKTLRKSYASICIFTQPYSQKKAYAKAPFAGETATIWQAYTTCMSHNSLTQPYAFRVFLLTPKFHMTRPLLGSSWEVSCGAQVGSVSSCRLMIIVSSTPYTSTLYSKPETVLQSKRGCCIDQERVYTIIIISQFKQWAL